MSMILAETYITCATQKRRLRTGEAQGSLCSPSFQAESVARTLQHGATAPRYNVHHNVYHTLLPFLYRRRIFSFPSPSTAAVIGACICCDGTNRNSAQHRTRHPHSLAPSHAVTFRWMGAGPCRFNAGCIVSQNWKQATHHLAVHHTMSLRSACWRHPHEGAATSRH